MERNESASYGRGLAISTVHWVRAWLRSVFNFAVNEKLIAENPVTKVKLPALDKSSTNPLTLEEALAFVSVKDNFWYGDAFIFQLHTGLRPEELMALIWDDIDFINGTVRIERACKWIDNKFIEFGPPKSRRSNRIIELSQEVLDLLAVHREKQLRIIEECQRVGSPYGERMLEEWIKKERTKQDYLYQQPSLIFPGHKGMVPNMNAPRFNFKAMLQRAGLKGSRLKVRWYDLRHTHATFLLILGVPAHEVAERLGHTVDELNRTYAHVLPGRQKMASRLFASLVPAKLAKSLTISEAKAHIKQLVSKSKKQFEENLLGTWGVETGEE
jgi:integrase